MSKKIKYFVYLLCIIGLLFVITACSKKEQKTDDIDNNIKMNILNISNNLISNITYLDDEQLDKNIKELENNKEFNLAVGIANWKSSKKEIGKIKTISIDSAVVAKDKDGFFVKVPIVGEQKKACFRIAFDQNLKKINSISIDIEYTIMEKLSKAFLNTLIGMSIVFIILIFIIFVISLFKYISIIEQKLKNKNNIEQDKKDDDKQLTTAFAEDLIKDEELVAVISAAIRAYEEEDSNDEGDLIVRKLNKRERKRIF